MESIKRNRTMVIVIATIAAVLLAAAALIATMNRPLDDLTGAPSTPTRTSSPEPRATATASPTPTNSAPPTAEAVPIGEDADFGDGVVATVTSVTPFEATGQGIGERSGPALRIELTVKNGSSADISLDRVIINLDYGDAATPAAPLASDQAAVPFSNTLPPGATATGTYSFSVPTDEQDHFAVSFGYAALSPIVVFQR